MKTNREHRPALRRRGSINTAFVAVQMFLCFIAGLSVVHGQVYPEADSAGDAYGKLRAEGEAVKPPAAPTSLSAVAQSPHQTDLRWIANPLPGSQFRIDRSVDGVHWTYLTTANAAARTLSDSVPAGTAKCRYRVRSENVFGNSDYCLSVTEEKRN